MGISVMVAITNLLDQAWSVVLVPVWARDSGYGVGAVGLLAATFGAAAVAAIRCLTQRIASLSADGRWLAYADWTETSNMWSLPIPTAGPASTRQAEPVTFGNQIIESSTFRPTAPGCSSIPTAAARWISTASQLREASPSGSPSRRPMSSGPSGHPTARRSPSIPSSMASACSS